MMNHVEGKRHEAVRSTTGTPKRHSRLANSACRCALHDAMEDLHTLMAHGQTRPPDPNFRSSTIVPREQQQQKSFAYEEDG